MINPIEWDGLSVSERALLVAAGETSPLAFTSLWFNVTRSESFQSNWHHHYFNWVAERLLSGEFRTVVINVAPGSTKTEFWSIHLPVYCMVKFPKVRILNGSYSRDLVVENSERSRAIVKSDEWIESYGHAIGRKDKADNWTCDRNGKEVFQMFSRSNGGQITGARGGYLGPNFSGYVVSDDWDKPDDMFSPAKRTKSHTRLVNTLRSRRASKVDGLETPMLFIQQRLHAEDSSSFILSGGMGVRIDKHITIPALVDQDYIDALPDGIRERCERDVKKGDCIGGKWSFWPDNEGIKQLLALRDAHPYTFVSQYMQDPDTLDGGIFAEGDFVYYGDDDDGADLPDPEAYEYRIVTVDTAQKTNVWNDWTVFAEWGVFEGRIYRLSMQRAKMKANTLRREFETFVKACHKRNGPRWGNLRAVYVEDKSSGTGLIQEVEGRLPMPIKGLPRDRDKLTRAMDVQSYHANGQVALPYGHPDNFEFVSEVAAFAPDDTHKHDDQTDVMVDALEQVFVIPNTGSKPRARML